VHSDKLAVHLVLCRDWSSTVWTGMPYRYFCCRPEAIPALAIQEISYQYDAQNTKMCITGQNITVRDKIIYHVQIKGIFGGGE